MNKENCALKLVDEIIQYLSNFSYTCKNIYTIVQDDSLARGPTEVYLQMFNEFVNQLTDD